MTLSSLLFRINYCYFSENVVFWATGLMVMYSYLIFKKAFTDNDQIIPVHA